MATRVVPSLSPLTVNPALTLEQYTILMEVEQLLQTFVVPPGARKSIIANWESGRSVFGWSCVLRVFTDNTGIYRSHRPAAAQQIEAGQSVAAVTGAPSAVAPPVLLRQYARAAVQHSEFAH